MRNLRRNRYERQGTLVENDAIEQAAHQCDDAASVRHIDTDYDDLLMTGADAAALEQVRDRVDHILST